MGQLLPWLQHSRVEHTVSHSTPWVLVRALPFLPSFVDERAATCVRTLACVSEKVPYLTGLRVADGCLQAAFAQTADDQSLKKAKGKLRPLATGWRLKRLAAHELVYYETGLNRLRATVQPAVAALCRLDPPAPPSLRETSAVTCSLGASGNIIWTHVDDVRAPRIAMLPRISEQLFETVEQPLPPDHGARVWRAQRVQTLLRWGADPNFADRGESLLRLAVKKQDAASVHAILSSGGIPQEPFDRDRLGMLRHTSAGPIRRQIQAALPRYGIGPLPHHS